MDRTSDTLASRWVSTALVYFVGAIALGIVMAASHDFRLKGLHVHLNLLGWVSMALFGVLLRLFPQLAASRLVTLHFWIYQVALPSMMAGLAGVLLGHPAFEPLVAAASIAVGLAVLLFAAAVWRHRGTRSAVDFQQLKPAT